MTNRSLIECERTTDQLKAGNVRVRRQWIPSHVSALWRELHSSPLSTQREVNHNAHEPLHGDASGDNILLQDVASAARNFSPCRRRPRAAATTDGMN